MIDKLLFRVLLLGSLLAFVGCASLADDPADAPPPAPCEDGSWGGMPEGVAAIYAKSSAAEDGDGSLASPFIELADAIEAARADGTRVVGALEGDYAGYFLFSDDPWGDDGLTLAGCGVDVTTLRGIEQEIPGSEPPSFEQKPVIEIYREVQGITISDLRIEGGRRGVIVRDGAGSQRAITLRNLDLDAPERIGVLINGLNTQVNLVDVNIRDVVAEAGLGWGIAIQAGGSVWDIPAGSTLIEGGSVSGASGVGVLVDKAVVDLSGFDVRGTAPVFGALGRGIQYQNNASGELDSITVEDNSDTGLYLHKPRGILVRDSRFGSTAQAAIPGVDGQVSGDGVSISQAGYGADPSQYLVQMIGNTFNDNDRAGVLLEDATLEVGAGNEFRDNIFGDGEVTFGADSVFFQGDAILNGLDGSAPPIEGVALGTGEFDAFEMNREPLGLDELAQ